MTFIALLLPFALFEFFIFSFSLSLSLCDLHTVIAILLNDLGNRRDTRSAPNVHHIILMKLLIILIFMYAGSIRIHNQTYQVIIKSFPVSQQTDSEQRMALQLSPFSCRRHYPCGTTLTRSCRKSTSLYIAERKRKKYARVFLPTHEACIRRDKPESTDGKKSEGED